MCEYSEKLIAWLDQELPEAEAAQVERHVGVCAECHLNLNSYQQVSTALDGYCDAVAAASPSEIRQIPRELPRWTPAAAAVAGAALLLFFLRPPFTPPSAQSSRVTSSPASLESLHTPFVEATTPDAVPAVANPRKRIRRQQPVVAPALNQNAKWAPAEPAIQIAIPSDAIFPPGAIPEGMTFFANVSIAADGSTQGIRLRTVSLDQKETEP